MIRRVCAVALAAGVMAGCGGQPWDESQYTPDQVVVQYYFKGVEEPTAKDAVWTAPDTFKVGVMNDGTRRDGYARYVCEVLAKKGFAGKKIHVQVVDIAKLAISKRWVKLGEADCN